jgi:hypothetical protein
LSAKPTELEENMRAFLMAMVVMLVVALGARYLMDGALSESSSEAFSSSSTRL